MRKLLLATAVLWPGLASAADICGALGAETIFHCTFDSPTRTVSVCDLPDSRFLYSYGKPGQAPELELTRTVSELTYLPWNGVGPSYWAALEFENEGYRYMVAYDMKKDGSEPLTGVLIIHGPDGKELANRSCRTGTITENLDEIGNRF